MLSAPVHSARFLFAIKQQRWPDRQQKVWLTSLFRSDLTINSVITLPPIFICYFFLLEHFLKPLFPELTLLAIWKCTCPHTSVGAKGIKHEPVNNELMLEMNLQRGAGTQCHLSHMEGSGRRASPAYVFFCAHLGGPLSPALAQPHRDYRNHLQKKSHESTQNQVSSPCQTDPGHCAACYDQGQIITCAVLEDVPDVVG